MNLPISSASHAIVLFAHGSRQASWAEPFLKMQSMLQQQSTDTVVEVAYLELMEPSLLEVCHKLVAQGIGNISIVPAFLGQGSHVRKDLPLLVEEIQQQHPAVKVNVMPSLGEQESVLKAMVMAINQQFI